MTETIREGDFILLFTPEGGHYLLRAEDRIFHTHRDSVALSDFIGRPFGSVTRGKNGTPFYAVRPTLHDHIMKVRRATQIIYPKEIGIILVKLDVSPGKTVVECGTGSGALTLALAQTVGPEGRVITYEREERFQKLAQGNLERAGLLERVVFKGEVTEDGFEEKEEADALFLDVREPWELLAAAWQALKGGAPFGALVPTVNQVSRLLEALGELPFIGLEVQEILQRFYKTNPERLRPEDRMVAHTGYLIFARKVFER
ncbi:tRNA (adenine-N1)-methyltransferase [Thermosulfurimonas dismutans]|uniref:tRNA (adenine(58)-N(1))-methyltransferase TrmI n=1 Tax=Thermosulfurimonas dismutans TaxID=999894 RepID=A0A179D4E0_9BACT|nr:tRNA (adenine-N1)-methyltransferase [Thermosulfurimonas dismutans]OAQ20589.1 protein-L-isoaspartate methyltransferase-like protein [Thermosulfurimonas dismutans]